MRRRNVFAMGLALAIGGAGAAFLVDNTVAAPPPLLQLLSPPGAGYDSTAGVLYTGSGGAVTFTRADTWTCPDSDGTIRSLASGAPCVVDGHDGAGSLRVRSAVTNLLPNSDDLSAASWTENGSPVLVTPNSWDYGFGVVGDTLTDDSAASSEGKYYSYATTTATTYTCSAFLQADSLTTARVFVAFVGGAAGSNTCSISGLDSTTQRKTCTATATGTVTAVFCGVVPGTGNADVGSVKAGGLQLVASSQPGDYCPTGAASDTCAAETATVATPAGLSRTEGAAKFCFTPSWTGANPLSTSTGMLVADEANAIRLGYMTAGGTNMQAFDGTSAPAVAAGLVAGVRKCYRTSWSAAGNFLKVENLSSGESGSSVFSTFAAFGASIYVGSLSGGGAPSNSSIDSVCLSSSPNGCQ